MKKLFLFLTMVLLIALPVNAAVSNLSYAPVNSADDTIKITGTADKGEYVHLIVLNPGYTYEDFISDSAALRNSAIRYVTVLVANTSNWEASPITLAKTGKYTVYANGVTSEINYSSTIDKKNAIDAFNLGTARAYDLITSFGLTNEPLAADSSAYTSRLNQLKGNISSADVDVTQNLIMEKLLLSAFDNNSQLLFSGNELNYSEELGISSGNTKIPEYSDYLNSLNSDGISNVKDGIVEGAPLCNNLSELSDKFKKLVYVNLVINYKDNGYGHIQTMFEKYPYYKSYGINYPSIENADMYAQLLDDDSIVDIEGIKNFINNYTPPADTGDSNTGTDKGSFPNPGGFSGGSSGSSGGSGSVVPPSIVQPSPETSVPSAPGIDAPSFSDMTEEHWAIDAVNALCARGIINGYGDGSYKPDNEVTRAEFAKLLVGVMGHDVSIYGATSFGDVGENDWFAPYIYVASKYGYIMGNGENFNPDDVITRQDAAIILARAAKAFASGESTFADADEISDYAKDAASAVQEAGLMQGMQNGNFAPLESLTRAQAATVLYRLLERGV